MSAELIRRKIGGRGYCRAEKKFFKRSGRNLTLQENLPTKVSAKVLRHRLRTKVCSIVYFWLRHQLWVKTRSMNGFGCIINGLKSVA